MQLLIQPSTNNTYNLIEITDNNYKCIITDSLENVLLKFKKAIINQAVPLDLVYSYNSDTNLVIDNTQVFPITIPASEFIK